MEVGVSFQRLRLGGGGARCWLAPGCPGPREAASTERAAMCALRGRGIGCCAACLVGGASYARAICSDDLHYSLDRPPGEASPPGARAVRAGSACQRSVAFASLFVRQLIESWQI